MSRKIEKQKLLANLRAKTFRQLKKLKSEESDNNESVNTLKCNDNDEEESRKLRNAELSEVLHDESIGEQKFCENNYNFSDSEISDYKLSESEYECSSCDLYDSDIEPTSEARVKNRKS